MASLGQGSRLDPDALSDVEARLREALFSYRAGDPETLRAVEGLYQALTTPLAPASSFASFPARRPPLERAERIGRHLEAAVRSGRLQITLEERPVVRMARAPSAEATLGHASTPERDPTFFEAAFVDEIGQGIPGVEVVLTVASEKYALTSDGGGKVHLDGVFATSFASVRVVNVDAVRDALKPRWDTVRDGPLLEPDESSTVVFLRGDTIDGVTIRSETLFTVSIQPYVVQARLLGMFFDTNKSFLLPSALVDVQRLPKLYAANPQSKLLCVGHTDTTGEPGINDPLSLERAKSLVAFLTYDVDTWLAMYDEGSPKSKRWSLHEDTLMIGAVASKAVLDADNLILAFQQFHNQLPPDERPARHATLQEDGIVGPLTRTQLIADYMNVDGTKLPEGIVPVAHGAGENFPLDASGEELDAAPADAESDQIDRRVEVFFFDSKLGVQPPPPGDNSRAGSLEYPEWRKRTREAHDREKSGKPKIELLLSWPVQLFEQLPEDLTLVLSGTELGSLEIGINEAERLGTRRGFRFTWLKSQCATTLEARGGSETLLLWSGQVLDDGQPFEWSAKLEDWAAERAEYRVAALEPGPGEDFVVAAREADANGGAIA